MQKEEALKQIKDILFEAVGKMDAETLLKTFQANLEEAKKYKKAAKMLKGNISITITYNPRGDRYEAWLDRGYEEPILIANTKEECELLQEVLK